MVEAEEDIDNVKYRDYLTQDKTEVADYQVANDKRIKMV